MLRELRARGATLPNGTKELEWRLVSAVVPCRLFCSAPIKTLCERLAVRVWEEGEREREEEDRAEGEKRGRGWFACACAEKEEGE